jgi:hypothetical protein
MEREEERRERKRVAEKRSRKMISGQIRQMELKLLDKGWRPEEKPLSLHNQRSNLDNPKAAIMQAFIDLYEKTVERMNELERRVPSMQDQMIE